MKIKYIVFSLTVFLLAMGSCKEALNMAPEGKLSYDDVFADNDKVGAFLNSCYAELPAKGNVYYYNCRGPVAWSDETWDADAEAEPTLRSASLYNGGASAASHPITDGNNGSNNALFWSRYWAGIRNCALFISRIETATVNNEDDRERWNAEAHLLRAFYYSELLKWYGSSLPIVREPYSYTDDFTTLTKPSYYEVVKFIIEDCDFVLAVPDRIMPWRITSPGEAGRFPKALAEAIKSQMILFAASPLNNAGNNYWEEAYTVTKASLANLKAKGYALYNTVNFPATYLAANAYLGSNAASAIYSEYFCTAAEYSETPVDKETIYQYKASVGASYCLGATTQYKTGECPSQESVDAYETIDGQPILNLANPYLDDQHTQPNYNTANTLYNPANPYVNRDPRFYASIYYNGSRRYCYWPFAEAATSYENFPAPVGTRIRIIATYINEPQTGIDGTSRRLTRTGYYLRKFRHPTAGVNNVDVNAANPKFYRLGEAVLNFAEAAAEAGHLPEAFTAVNEIRTRAGMPDLPSTLTKSELILRIHAERRVELAFEENRYFDIRRWSTPTGDLSKTDRWVTAMAITRASNGTYTYVRRPVRNTERLCYTNKFLWVPVPLAEANALKANTGINWQSPGW